MEIGIYACSKISIKKKTLTRFDSKLAWSWENCQKCVLCFYIHVISQRENNPIRQLRQNRIACFTTEKKKLDCAVPSSGQLQLK